jgi:hypothetical protein
LHAGVPLPDYIARVLFHTAAGMGFVAGDFFGELVDHTLQGLQA